MKLISIVNETERDKNYNVEDYFNSRAPYRKIESEDSIKLFDRDGILIAVHYKGVPRFQTHWGADVLGWRTTVGRVSFAISKEFMNSLLDIAGLKYGTTKERFSTNVIYYLTKEFGVRKINNIDGTPGDVRATDIAIGDLGSESIEKMDVKSNVQSTNRIKERKKKVAVAEIEKLKNLIQQKNKEIEELTEKIRTIRNNISGY